MKGPRAACWDSRARTIIGAGAPSQAWGTASLGENEQTAVSSQVIQ